MTVYNLTCDYCGSTFTTIGKPHQKFCSISCGGKGRKENILDVSLYNGEWNALNSYLAGMIWSDGNLSFSSGGTPKISIYSRDRNHIEKLHSVFGKDRKIFTSKNWQGNDGYMIYTSSIPDFKFLSSAGLIENKSLTIGGPVNILDYAKYFLLGFFDGDGSISLSKRKTGSRKYISLTFTTGSELLKVWIRDTLMINGISSSEWIDGRCGNPKYTANNIYTISVLSRKENVKKFFDFLYSDLSIPYMDRKYNKFLEYFSQ